MSCRVAPSDVSSQVARFVPDGLPELHTMKSDTSVSSVCRICHDGADAGKLVSPCKCCGTMALVHLPCMERWLSAANSNSCEICGHQFVTQRTNRTFIEWLRNPSKPADLRNLIADCICFIVLTPLASVSSWLCISGAMYYSTFYGGWEGNGLLILSSLLLIVYIVWCLVATRYHARVFSEWRKVNQIVRIINSPSGSTPSDQGNSHFNEEEESRNNSTTPYIPPTNDSSKNLISPLSTEIHSKATLWAHSRHTSIENKNIPMLWKDSGLRVSYCSLSFTRSVCGIQRLEMTTLAGCNYHPTASLSDTVLLSCVNSKPYRMQENVV